MTMEEVKKALRVAVENGDLEVMIKILDENCIDIMSDIGHRLRSVFCTSRDTALALAAKHGHWRCVEKLLEIGTSVYINGVPEFYSYEHKIICGDLIDAMVNAASEDHLECVKLLTEMRILNGHFEDEFYSNFIRDVRQHINNKEYVDNLLRMLHAHDRQTLLRGWRGNNVVSLFLAHNQNIWHLINDYGISVNGWDYNGLTPLMMAVIMKDLQAAKYLLNNGADVRVSEILRVDAFRSDGTIDFKPSEEEREHWGPGSSKTALMYAAGMRNPSMLSLLLDFTPADVVNWNEGEEGRVPLMFAAYVGDVESVSIILDSGAICDTLDYRGNKLSYYAAHSGNPDCLDFVLKKVGSSEVLWNTHQFCINHDEPRLLSTILKYYNKPGSLEFYDHTYLMDAVLKECFNSAQVLIDNGHEVDKRNSTGMTALMMACLTGKHKAIPLLVKNGADVNAQSNEGITPIMFAASKGFVECMKMLMEYEANLDIVDKYKQTVLSATMSRAGSCLDTLLESGRIFEDDDKKRLKSVHNQAMTSYRGVLPVSNLITAMRRGIFLFEWTNIISFKNICFAVISSGLSPVKFTYNRFLVSLLAVALQTKFSDWGVLKYLIANLYFFPEDYAWLSRHVAYNYVSDPIETEGEICSALPPSFYETISSQPLSLKVWSFLAISKALSLSGCRSNSAARTSLVESLPIPEPLKIKLSFNSSFSQLCMDQWDEIGSRDETRFHKLADLMFETSFFWKDKTSMRTRCEPEYRLCEGLGFKID